MKPETKKAKQIWETVKEDIRLYCDIELYQHPELADKCVEKTRKALINAIANEIGIIDYKRWCFVTAHNFIHSIDSIQISSLITNDISEVQDDILSFLSSGARDILIARYKKHKPFSEISKEFEIPENVARQRFVRARTKYLKTAEEAYDSSMSDKYQIGPDCIIDVTNEIIYSASLKRKKKRLNPKSWNVISALIENSLEGKVLSGYDFCNIYSSDEAVLWTNEKRYSLTYSAIKSLNSVLGDKCILGTYKKGFIFKNTPTKL